MQDISGMENTWKLAKYYFSHYSELPPGDQKVYIIIVVLAVLGFALFLWALVLRYIYFKYINVSSTHRKKTVSCMVLRGIGKRRRKMKKALQEATEKYGKRFGKKVYFSYKVTQGYCNAFTDGKDTIGFNQHYAALLFDGEETVFELAAYHEMGHIILHGKEGYKKRHRGIRKSKFYRWLEESYCDHTSLKLGPVNSSEEWIRLKAGIFPKRVLKRDSMGHPSWVRRFEYIKVDFGEELISRVARDVNYRIDKDDLEYIANNFT